MANLHKDFDKEEDLSSDFSKEQGLGASFDNEPDVSKTESAVRGTAQGLTFGAEPLLAGIGAGISQLATGDYGPVPGRSLEALAAAKKQMQQQEIDKNLAAKKAHPYIYGGTQLAGSIPTAMALGPEALGTTGLESAALTGTAAGEAGYLGSTTTPNMEGAVTSAGTGLVTGVGLHEAAPAVLGAAKDALGGVSQKVGQFIEETPYLRQAKIRAQAGAEGQNLGSEEAQIGAENLPVAGETPETSLTAQDAAEKFTARIQKARDSLGDDVNQAVDKAQADGVKINITDDLQNASESLIKEFQENPLIIQDPRAKKVFEEILTKTGRGRALSPKDTKIVIDSMDNLASNLETDPSLTAQVLRKNVFAFRSALKSKLEQASPEIGEASARYHEFMKLVPETIMSRGKPVDVTKIWYGDRTKAPEQLHDAVVDMLTGVTSTGPGTSTAKATFSALRRSLGKLDANDQKRAAQALLDAQEGELPPVPSIGEVAPQFQRPTQQTSPGEYPVSEIQPQPGELQSGQQLLTEGAETPQLPTNGQAPVIGNPPVPSTQQLPGSPQQLPPMAQTLQKLVDTDTAAQAASGGKPFESALTKMGLNRDTVLKFIKSEGDKVAALGTQPTTGGKAIPLTPTQAITAASKNIGLSSANRAGLLYHWSDQKLTQMGNILTGIPGVSHLGTFLNGVIQKGDVVAKNAAVFAIIQNPKFQDLVKTDPRFTEFQQTNDNETSGTAKSTIQHSQF